MQVDSLKTLIFSLMCFTFSRINGEFIDTYLCPKSWVSQQSICWKSFNESDYCGAFETCSFYGTSLSNTTSSFVANATNVFWTYDNLFIQDTKNKSCYTRKNSTLTFCPVTFGNGSLGTSNCSDNERYICRSESREKEIGFGNGRIKNKDLSSSTFYKSDYEPIPYRPRFARLSQPYVVGTATQGGWCSLNISGEEYFEVNFEETILVTMVAIQGVKSRGCDYWLTFFNVSYLSPLNEWIDYSDNGTAKTLAGNKNSDDIANVTFSEPFLSRKLRVLPTGSGDSCLTSGKRFCLRMEVYGINLRSFAGKEVALKQEYSKINTYADKTVYDSHIHWPSSIYALPKPKNGCPGGSQWDYGYLLHDVKIIQSNNRSLDSSTNLLNTVSSRFFVEEFCTKTFQMERQETSFPAGQYCIYMVGEQCPLGFQAGSIRFFENSSNWNSSWSHSYGNSPKTRINYNASDVNCCFTEIFYCCRNDTSPDKLQLPSSMPFYLIPSTNTCPEVENTQNSREHVDIEIGEAHFELYSVGFGFHPYIILLTTGLENRKAMRYYLCYYEPLVTNSTHVELLPEPKTCVINANYALDLQIFMLFNDSSIQYGEYSVVSYSISVAANCSVFATQNSFNSSNGKALYGGSLCPGEDCNMRVNGMLEIKGMLPSRKIVNASVNCTIFSKTNILIFVDNETLEAWPSLETELLLLQTKLNTHYVGPKRNVILSLFAYKHAYDVVKKLRDFKDKEKSDPDTLHSIIAPNADKISTTLSSFAGIYNIPFLTGQTNADQINVLNEVTLQMDTTYTSGFYIALKSIKEINITEVVVIRSQKLRIPPSLAYYLMKFKIAVSKDLVMSERANVADITKTLTIVSKRKTNIYFIVDEETSPNLFVAAVQLGISPIHGYTWISGSRAGTFEYGVGSRLCYKLRPVSCGAAFRGVMVFNGYSSLSAAPLASYIEDATVSIDSVSMEDKNSGLNALLFKDMILDGAASVKESIQILTNRSETIRTDSIMSLIQERKLQRLVGLRYFGNQSKISHENSSLTCQIGWTGLNCSLPHCVDHHCPLEKGRCVAYETCECLPGFYGKDCSGICKNRCKHGVCNDGALGDGTCLECNWLYEGVYCDKATVLQALVASCLGTLMVVIIVTCYLLKVCRPSHSSLNVGDNNETYWIVDWGAFTEFEQQHLDKDMVVRHLSEKMKYTYYYKAKLRGESVFVTCWKKKPIKLSLDIRVEIRKVKKLDHINIEKIKAVCLGPPFVAIVTELASMGSLYDTLHAENVDVPLEIKYAFMEDICRGMMFLHDNCGLTHGRLKSTNCLLHKGWRVKITDIGLPSLRKSLESNINSNTTRKYGYCNQDANQQKQNTTPVDFNSLLWTAPEYLSPSIVNIDQIGHVRFEGDVYSFGILMAEILTRRPPYSEIKLMSVQHIIEAVAHLREPMVDLEVIRPGSPTARQDLLSQQAKIMRPRVQFHDLPKEEPGKSILKVLLDSAWSDDPDVRPPFSHIKSVLRIIAPLKGDQMEKRAFLLEKETETLEKYISYDTRMLEKEREKAEDWLKRSVPSDIYMKICDGDQFNASSLECVSVASFQIEDFQEIVSKSDPDELAGLLDYIFKSFSAIATKLRLDFAEIEMTSNSFIIVSDGRNSAVEAEPVVIYCLHVLKRLKNLEVIYNPSLSLRFRVAAHCGYGVAGIMQDNSETLKYKVFGDVIKATIKLSRMSKPNCLLITETCARLIEKNNKMSLVQRSGTFIDSGFSLKTYWVIST